MSDEFGIGPNAIPVINAEKEWRSPRVFLDLVIRYKFLIGIILAILGTAVGLIVWKNNEIRLWFEAIGPQLETWFKNPENDWMYLILLIVLLQVYKKFPKFFAPVTALFVMGVMVLLCFQYNNFNAEEVVNKWLIVGLIVLPVIPLIAVMVTTRQSWMHLLSIALYVTMVALLLVINPGDFLGKNTQDTTNVYVVGLIGLFAMLCVYLNRHFTQQLWPTYITKLGFILICLLTAAFTFQYAVRFSYRNRVFPRTTSSCWP
jgi:hypothetical protein